LNPWIDDVEVITTTLYIVFLNRQKGKSTELLIDMKYNLSVQDILYSKTQLLPIASNAMNLFGLGCIPGL